MSLPYNEKFISLARALRKDMTKQERHLWYDFLSKYPARFQRQKTISNYIADFYCSSAKLIIEIDGSQHYSEDKITHDEERTKKLSSFGIQLIRFSNKDVDDNFRGVCEEIDRITKCKLPQSPEVTAPSEREPKLPQSPKVTAPSERGPSAFPD
jgi:very-short-patch-repair endonuclease